LPVNSTWLSKAIVYYFLSFRKEIVLTLEQFSYNIDYIDAVGTHGRIATTLSHTGHVFKGPSIISIVFVSN
jgi:hypothetical protein